ncbi:unnamed protein product, partial [Candidula unifasciata]
ENDGFPLAATQEEIRQFDEQLVTGKRRNLKKKSWSFSEVIAQRNIRFPVLFEDINICRLSTDRSQVICFACQEDNTGHLNSDAYELPEIDCDVSHTSVFGCSKWLHVDPVVRLPDPPISEHRIREIEELNELYELADDTQLNSQVIVYGSHILSLNSLVLPDYLTQQSEAVLPSVQPQNDSIFRGRKLRRSKSDRSNLGITSVKDLQKPSLNLQAEESNLWRKNYYSIVKDSTFPEAVMAKGYVRALAEQINQQGTLKVMKDEDIEEEDSNSEVSQSASSVICARNDEVQVNLVHKLIKAAEEQKFKEDRSLRKFNALAHDDTDLNNHSEPDWTGLTNRHLVSEFRLKAESVHSLHISAEEKTPSSKTGEARDNLTLSITSSDSQLHAAEETKSHYSLPCSPFRTSPMGYASLSPSAIKPKQSTYSTKSAAKYASKPKVPPKPNVPALKGRTSALPSDSVLSPQSPCKATPHTCSPEASPVSASSQNPQTSEALVVQLSSLTSPLSPISSSRIHSESTTQSPGPPPKTPIPPKHSPKSPTVCSVTSISVSSSKQSTLSTSITPKHPQKSPPPSPNLTIIPSLITAVASAFFAQPSNSVAPHSPRPTFPPPRTPLSPNLLKEATAASTHHKETVEQWLHSTHSSSTTDTNSDDVLIRTVSKRSSEQYRDSVFSMIYDNPASLTAAELFDSSWSDSDSCDDTDDSDDGGGGEVTGRRKAHRSGCYVLEQVDTKINSQSEVNLKDKRFHIAQELLQTEKDYVAVLHLLHHVFYERLDSENHQQSFLPADALKHMFSNTKSIYLFHNDFLLPQLENRMKNWEHDPRIGDLMKKNAPFLKMYTEYVRNFDRAMKLINQWMEKSTKFSEIIQDIQKLPECRNLSLQHHMLGPIQRVPRYELLLKDYVRHLPEDSPDMNDAKDALDLVTKAACHSNEAMNKIETFQKLLDIYQSLRGVPVDFISPAREFVTQGPVTKIAARSGEKQLRHLFLFNDLVLVCIQYNLLGTYSVRSQLELDGMEIKPGTSMHIPNTFLVHSKQKVVELLD